MTILKHEAKKIDNFSKVKFPISVFSVRLCNNCSIKEKYTLHLKKEKKKKRKVQASDVINEELLGSSPDLGCEQSREKELFQATPDL